MQRPCERCGRDYEEQDDHTRMWYLCADCEKEEEDAENQAIAEYEALMDEKERQEGERILALEQGEVSSDFDYDTQDSQY